jgi:TRAP-type C4-dicarboxylate transport system permease small subunit
LKVLNLLKFISRGLSMVALILVLPLMLLIVADVVSRFFFNNPITGTAEIAATILVCMVLGVSWAAFSGIHIKVGLIMDRVPRRVQNIVDLITLLGGLFVCTIISWRSFIAAVFSQQIKEVATVLLPIPSYPFKYIFFAGWVMLTLVVLTLLIQKFIEAVRK